MRNVVLRLLLAGLLFAQFPVGALAQDTTATSPVHLLFAYFKGNGEDGLHLAYSQDGLRWRALKQDQPFLAPQVGHDRLMRDPSIVRGPDSLYHMVWTVSWNEKGIGYAHSRDLIHWSEQRYLPVMEHEEAARNCWAPELFYDEATGQYLIFWATTIPGRFPETDGQDARAGSPGWNHRMYYVTTRDFEHFSEASLFYEQGFNVIDAFLIKDGGRYVMLLKDETNRPFTPQKNIRLAFSDRAEGPYSAPTAPITGPYWAEGPTAVKIGAQWYVYFDKYREGEYGVLTSADLEHWTDRSDELVMPEGIRHGTVFEVQEETARALLHLD